MVLKSGEHDGHVISLLREDMSRKEFSNSLHWGILVLGHWKHTEYKWCCFSFSKKKSLPYSHNGQCYVTITALLMLI